MSKRKGKVRGKARCVECGQVLRPLGRTPGSPCPERGCPVCMVRKFKEAYEKAEEVKPDAPKDGDNDTA